MIRCASLVQLYLSKRKQSNIVANLNKLQFNDDCSNNANFISDRLAISNHTLCLPAGQHPFDIVKDASIYEELNKYPSWRAKLYEINNSLYIKSFQDDRTLREIANRLRKTCTTSMDLCKLLRATKSAELCVRVGNSFVHKWGLHDLRALLSITSSQTKNRSKTRKRKKLKTENPPQYALTNSFINLPNAQSRVVTIKGPINKET